MVILLFIVALALLILSHEFGHFICAKLSKTKVEEFGFGFPPRIFGIKKGETVYSINWIPFGGFVKVLGEDSADKQAGSFASKPIYIRAIILAAGVFFNLVLAWILFSVVFMAGAPSSVDDDAFGIVTILEVQKGTPAEEIGLLPGDKIQRLFFEGEILESDNVIYVQEFISKHKGQEIEMEILRGKELIKVIAIPNPNPPEGVGALGIAMDKIGIVSMPFHKAVWNGAKDTVFLTVLITKAFANLITDLVTGAGAAIQVAGPIGIVNMVGTASEFGLVYVIQFIALLSINLAIINMIPFPALDGGRLLFLAIEAIKRSPINPKITMVANSIGFFILVALMLLITFQDIIRLVE